MLARKGVTQFITDSIAFELGAMETIIRRSECFREIHLHNINCVPLVRPPEFRFFGK